MIGNGSFHAVKSKLLLILLHGKAGTGSLYTVNREMKWIRKTVSYGKNPIFF